MQNITNEVYVWKPYGDIWLFSHAWWVQRTMVYTCGTM